MPARSRDPGNPTNRGPDPYLATRGDDGWSTRYVGIPADINMVSGPFSSTLAEASAGLEAFAFGGDELCAPCFTEGIETGIPVRLPERQPGPGDGRLALPRTRPRSPKATSPSASPPTAPT